MEMARVANESGRDEDRDTFCDRAVARYGRAIAANPIDAGTHYEMGTAYLLYNFPLMTYQDRARAYFRQALEFKPADETINLNVLFLYFTWWPTLEDADKAYAAGVYRKMLVRDPAFPAKLEGRWIQSNQPPDALRSLLAELCPASPRSRLSTNFPTLLPAGGSLTLDLSESISRQVVRSQPRPRAGGDVGRDAPDGLEPLGRPLLLEDVEADAVHGHGVAAEEDAVVPGDLGPGDADRRDLGRLADMEDRLVLDGRLGQDRGDGLLAVVDVEADLVRGHAQGDVLRRPGDAAVLVVLEDGDVDELGDVLRHELGQEGLVLVLDRDAVELAGDLLGDPPDPLAVAVVRVEPADLFLVLPGLLVALFDERPEPGDGIEDLAVGGRPS